MNMRWDAPEVIQSTTSATAALLNTQECNIINSLARGASHKKVARKLGRSPETVKSYMKRMMVRLQVHPTKTHKDTPAARCSFEPMGITRPSAVLRLAGQ
jgi:DNA-binding NarL/FixJ family response regulator